MTLPAPGIDEIRMKAAPFPKRHFLSVTDLDPPEVTGLLDLADLFVALNRQKAKKLDLLKGRTLVNLFFEASTRTQSSFELAGKRLGADVVNMSPRASSISKGETLIDTAVTLNAMQPDILVVRHGRRARRRCSRRRSTCSVINAGDGQHEHPSQALLDALSLRRAFGRIDGLTVAICGDVLHSRVARSNVALLHHAGRADVRLVGPPTLMPDRRRRAGASNVFHDMQGRHRRGRRGDDAAPAARAHAGRPGALDARVLPPVRPRPREARPGRAAGEGHASRAR